MLIPLPSPHRLGSGVSSFTRTSLPLASYAAPRALAWLLATDVAVDFVEPTTDSDRNLDAPARHINSLFREDYELPLDRFGTSFATVDPNLVSIVEEAAREFDPDHKSVVRPVGSITYARRDGSLVWDLVRDVDVWCYVTDEVMDRHDPEMFHRAFARTIHTVMLRHGLRVEYERKRDFLFLVDHEGRRLLVEAKLAPLSWLAQGIEVADRMNFTLRWRRHPAYFAKPRAEWAAYCAYENHFPSAAAEADFEAVIGSLTGDQVLFEMKFAYLENMAEALRRFGILRTGPATINASTFRVIHAKLLKKVLFFGHVTRDQEAIDFAIDELIVARRRGDQQPNIVRRFEMQAELYRRISGFQRVEVASLLPWIGAAGRVIDVRAPTVVRSSLSKSRS